MGTISLVLGGLEFYTLQYGMKLIPQSTPIWGQAGVIVLQVSGLLEWSGFGPGGFVILMLMNEVCLGGWLIVSGFNPSVIPSGAAGSDAG
jgi:hypothetical protein